MSIQPLPPAVVAQIKSSIAITSLNGVILELMKNSLDAVSTKVDITANYDRGGCIVEDDGLGILPSEFTESGGLGKIYHTSKLSTQTPVYGGHGKFLASVSAIALLSVTSHHHQHRSHNTITMHGSEVLTRQTPAPVRYHLPYFNHGTRVTVQDLFGSMPVRVKQRAIVAEKHRGWSREWEELKRDAVLLLLSWPSCVAVTIREVGTNQKLIIRASWKPLSSPSKAGRANIRKVCSILSQASFITPDEKPSWVPVSASTPKLEINGAISLDPSATKHVQFLSFGIQPVVAIDGQSVLHKQINHLFLNSAFGNEEEVKELDDVEKGKRVKNAQYKGDGYTNKELKAGRKGVDRWPMFYINIQQSSTTNRLEANDILDGKGNILSIILELLQAIVLEFLTKYHFRPKVRPKPSQESIQTRDELLPHRTSTKPPDTNITEHRAPGKSIVAKMVSGSVESASCDTLDLNEKLPFFHRPSSRPDSAFHEWSRIKLGTTTTKTITTENTDRTSFSQHPHPNRPSTTPPSSRSKSRPITESTSTPHIIRPSSTPLISSSGKIIRRPFEDVETHRAPSRLTTLQQSSKPTKVAQQHTDGDEIMIWINPITKVESVINERTGLTISAHKGHSADLSHLSRTSVAPVCSRKKLRSTIKPINSSEPSPWLHGILKGWDNPIFRPTELSIPQVSLDGPDADTQHNCSHINIDRAFRETSAGLNERISKDALQNAEIVSQVDKKFILIKVRASDTSSAIRGGDIDEASLLVIIDQHAADERIRIESLMSDLCAPPPPDCPSDSSIATILLEKPLSLDISSKEISLLRTQKQHFANWGILYTIPEENVKGKGKVISTERLTIRALPPGIVERCKLDPRLLIELIRTEAWKVHDSPFASTAPSLPNARTSENTPEWLTRIHTCPQGILDMLNSRACRSAIMFNDELTREQCEILVRRLGTCVFPFQCAHGRPSLIPLVNLDGGMRVLTRAGDDIHDGNFGKAFERWKQSLGEKRIIDSIY